MSAMASQITSRTIAYSTVYLSADKKTSKLRVTGHCAGDSPGTGEFPAQRASNAGNFSTWWRHHGRESLVCYVKDVSRQNQFGWDIKCIHVFVFHEIHSACQWGVAVVFMMTIYNEFVTKWPPFCRRYLQMYFLVWKLLCLDKIVLKFVHMVTINNN